LCKVHIWMADTGIGTRNFSAWRSRLLAGGLLDWRSELRIRRTSGMFDLYRAVASGRSVDAVDPYGALVKESLPDRMRNHGVDPRPDTVCLLASARRACACCAARRITTARPDPLAIGSRRCVRSRSNSRISHKARRGLEACVHCIGDIPMNFERMDDRHLQTTGACRQTKQD